MVALFGAVPAGDGAKLDLAETRLVEFETFFLGSAVHDGRVILGMHKAKEGREWRAKFAARATAYITSLQTKLLDPVEGGGEAKRRRKELNRRADELFSQLRLIEASF